MKSEKEIRQIIENLFADIRNYQQLHEEGLIGNANGQFPKYNGSWKQSIDIANGKIFILKMVLEDLEFKEF